MSTYGERMAKLDTAIREYASDAGENSEYVTGWVLYVAGTPIDREDDVTSYMTARPEGQPYHATIGLLHSAVQDFSRGMANDGSDE